MAANPGVTLALSGSTTYRNSPNRGFAVRVNAPEMTRLILRFAALRSFFTDVLPAVRPEFGAYMRYSPILEARHPKAKGHIVGAITYNQNYIRTELQRRVIPIAIRYAHTGSFNRAQAKQEVEHQWEIVLNRNPRFHAMRNAPVMYGFHRSTIRGYGKPRLVSEIRAQQTRLHTERETMRRGKGTTGRSQIKRRLDYYNRYSS